MADKARLPDFNFTAPVRVAYADIMKARAFEKAGKAKGDPKFAGTFMCLPDNPDLLRLKKEVVAMAQAEKPGKKFVTRRLTQEELEAGNVIELAVPWKDGNKEADRIKANGKDGEAFRGFILVKASSKYAPALAAIEGGVIKEYANEETRPTASKFFYSGAYILPSLGLHWYKGDEGKPDGVSLYFNAVCFVKHGEKMGGSRPSAAETFKGYVGTLSAEDPTAGGDDLEGL